MNWVARAKKVLVFALVLVLVFSLSSFTVAFAAIATTTGQFQVHVSVSGDTIPPSVPTGLSATAVSQSQIDLSWNASTDNVGVTGYSIYRDGVYLTTVAGPTYSDIGLSASTLYTYTVSALDGSGNESAQSAPVSATTFAAVVTPPPSGGGGGGGGSSSLGLLYNVQVVPGYTNAIVSWQTANPAISTLSWGLTTSYELGQSPELIYSRDHAMTIPNLNSGTVYYFQIEVQGVSGAVVDYNGAFTTLSLRVGDANPDHFVAVPNGQAIDLSWINPQDSEFSNVRLVRSTSYFPSAPDDGDVIYEGNNEKFVDTNVVAGTRYFYGLFAKYADGSYSSGALATAIISSPGQVVTVYDPFDTLPPATGVAPQIAALTFLDFDFIQNGAKLPKTGAANVAIDGNENLTVSIDYDKVPEVLKSLIVTLSYPDHPEETFSFLLRVNSDKTRYEATIAPLGVSGIYGVQISIVDFKDRGLKKILGSLYASADIGFLENRKFIPALITIVSEDWFDILLLLLLIAVIARALYAEHRRVSKIHTVS